MTPGTDKKKVLVVDDEPDIRELVMYNLRREGFDAEGEGNGEEALYRITRNRYDLVVLDLMLPGIKGTEICRRLRENPETASLPILMLTAKSEDSDKIHGLDLGADDYLTKPFNPKELAARVKAILRRAGQQGEAASREIVTGNLRILTDEFRVLKGGRELELSPTEYKLLLFLVERRGKVYNRDQLLDYVWQGDSYVEPRTVDVHIRRLRMQIEDDPSEPVYIKTRRGAGYYFGGEQ